MKSKQATSPDDFGRCIAKSYIGGRTWSRGWKQFEILKLRAMRSHLILPRMANFSAIWSQSRARSLKLVCTTATFSPKCAANRISPYQIQICVVAVKNRADLMTAKPTLRAKALEPCLTTFAGLHFMIGLYFERSMICPEMIICGFVTGTLFLCLSPINTSIQS